MLEISVVSSSKIKLREEIKKGNNKAVKTLRIVEDPTNVLSSIQIGITLIGILAGVIGGAALSEDLTKLLSSFAILGEYASLISYIIVVIIITYISLVVGELVPKKVGLSKPEKLAVGFTGLLDLMNQIFFPFVKVLSGSTNLILKFLRIKSGDKLSVSEEEVKIMLQYGTQTGVFEEIEKEMVERIFMLSDKKVSSIMLNRRDVEWIDINDDIDVIITFIKNTKFSRLLVCKENIDNVLGVLPVKNVLLQLIDKHELNIKVQMREPLFVPESMSSFKLFELFKKSGLHFAIVVNEYGGTEGIITLSNILEAIVGDISSPEITEERSIIKRDDGSYLIDGLIEISELKELLSINYFPNEENEGFLTLGGFIMSFLGKIPVDGEKFIFDKYIFEIMDMDYNRIDKVLIKINEEKILSEEDNR